MSETNRFTCPHCGQSYNLNAELWAQYQGRLTTCKKCQQKFRIGATQADAAAPAAPAAAAPGESKSAASVATAAQAGAPAAAPGSPHPEGSSVEAGSAPALRRGNGLAVASLILSILFFIPLSSLAGLILGMIGLKRAKVRGAGKGAALAGVVLGALGVIAWVGAAVVGVPKLLQMRQVAYWVDCGGTMHDLALPFLHYAQTHGDAYPPDLDTLAKAEQLGPEKFICKASGDAISTPNHESYIYVGAKLTLSSPLTAVVLYEPLSHHINGSNMLFADGHVDFVEMTPEQAATVFKQLQAGQNPPPALPPHR